MGRRTRAFRARLAPVDIPGPLRGFTWPLVTPDAPLSPKAQLSISTEVYPLDVPFYLDDVESAVSEEEADPSAAGEGSTAGTADKAAEHTGVKVTRLKSSTQTGSTGNKRKRRRRTRGQPWVPPAAPNHFIDRPCEHNCWDNVRVKKDKTTLRCRICQLQWKVDAPTLREGLTKCQEYYAHGRCSKGDRCRKIHVHRCKLNLTKRQAIWGDELRLPHAVPDICAPCEEPAATPLNVACTAFEPRSPTGGTMTSTGTSYTLETPQVATPQGLGQPGAFQLQQQSCSSQSPTTACIPTLRVYSHNPYELQLPSSQPSPLTEPTGTTSGSSLWTAGHSSPHSRRGSVGQSKQEQQQRMSTGSGGIAVHEVAAQAPQAVVQNYYQPCPLPFAIPLSAAEAGPPAAMLSPTSSGNTGSSPASNGTIPVTLNVVSLPPQLSGGLPA